MRAVKITMAFFSSVMSVFLFHALSFYDCKWYRLLSVFIFIYGLVIVCLEVKDWLNEKRYLDSRRDLWRGK